VDRGLERRLFARLREKLGAGLAEFVLFGLKQAWACVFAGSLLLLILATRLHYPFESFARYDFLLGAALALQIFLVASGLEQRREVVVIALFHLVATGMELFKTSEAIASWSYPEPCRFAIAGVPLFAGFMYSAVGSYIARVWRSFRFRFEGRIRLGWLGVLAVAAYLNFFTHHYVVDLRWLLLALIAWELRGTVVVFHVTESARRMPLLLGLGLVALFIWFAENLATLGGVWLYPSQLGSWHMVSPHKILAWFLLMFLSFVMVALLHRRALWEAAEPARPRRRVSSYGHAAAGSLRSP
jgi:uncharacterized membrane protein YoaT (DUF817 family)